MDTTRAEQIASGDSLVAPANRLKIGKSNLRLSSDLKSKEATLQVFWATAKVYHHSIRFKMNNKKHIMNLEYFRAMLQICPKLPNQQFKELPFEEAILTFLRDLGHSREIKVITDVNVNKLHQPWRSFAAEDFVYQVENKNVKKSNEMYYPRFTKVIVNFFMTKDQSIPRQKSVNWHHARDDYMFTTIKVVSRHEDTQLYGAILPNELTNEDIRKPERTYKEYNASKRLKTSAKAAITAKKKQDFGKYVRKQKKSSSNEDDDAESENDNDNDDADNQDDDGQEYDEHDDEEHDDEEQGDDDAQTDSDNDGDDFVHPKFSTHDEENKEEDSFDLQVQTPSYVESTDDEDSDEEIQDANVEGYKMNEEETNEEAEVDALYKDVNVNLERRDTEMTDIPRTIIQTTQVIEDTHVIITPVNPEGQQQSSSMSSGFVSNMLNPSPDTGIDSLFNLNTESTSLVDVLVTTFAEPPLLSATTLPPPPTPLIIHLQQTPVPTPPTVPSSSLQDLPNFSSLFGFDHRLKTLEKNILEFNQTNQFAAAIYSIPSIVDAYLANKMHEAVKTTIQLQSKRLKDEAQAENADFINKLDDNIKKIIKDQTVNEQLEAEVLTRSSNESKTSHDVAANLSELELKKILIDKMESNKSIHRSNEQKNLYKELVDAYESDKLILDTYRDTVLFKKCRDDKDKDEEPSAGSNLGSKRRRAGKEPESTSVPKEKTSNTAGKSTEGSKSHHKYAGESAQAEEPMHTAKYLEEPGH
ncbi:hypothetical protein Tco_0970929 [Tanacetum coccineum]